MSLGHFKEQPESTLTMEKLAELGYNDHIRPCSISITLQIVKRMATFLRTPPMII